MRTAYPTASFARSVLSLCGSQSGQPARCTRSVTKALMILVALVLLGCGSIGMDEEAHFQRGLELEARGDLRAATIEFKNALQQNPSNAEARLRLAGVSLRLGDTDTARNELRRANELGADPLDASLLLARIDLLDRDYAAVIERLGAIDPADADAASKADIHLLRGEALAALGDADAAIAAFEQALEQPTQPALAHVGIAAVHIANQRLGDAQGRLETAIRQEPALYQAWHLLGDLKRFAGELDAAESAYTRAIEHNPTPYVAHLKRALTRLAQMDVAGAEEDLGTLRRIGPRQPGTAYTAGLLQYQAGRYPEAQSAFESSLSHAGDFMPAVFYLAASHFAQQNWQQAERNLVRFLRAHPDSSEATNLLAYVRLQEGSTERAQDLLRPVLSRNPDDVLALNLMGALYLARGEHQEGIGHLRRLAELRPDDAVLRASLGRELVRAGQPQEGLRELERAIAEAPEDLGVEAAYIVSLIETGAFDAALTATEELLRRAPGNAIPYNLKAATYAAMGQGQRARDALLDGLSAVPGEPALSDNLARMALEAGDADEARRVYRQALEANPNHLGMTLRLAQIEAEVENYDSMRRLVEDAIRTHPEAVAPRLVLARFHLSRDEPRRALALLDPVREVGREDPQLLEMVARAQIGAGQRAQAVTTLRSLAEISSDTAEAQYRLGLGFELAGSPRDARSQYGRALELDRNHAETLARLGDLEFGEGRLGESLAVAHSMQAIDDQAAEGYFLEGRVHTASSEYALARDAFREAHQLEPSAQTAVALGTALLRLDKTEEAVRVLKARLDDYPDETFVRFHLAQALLRTDDQDAALKQHEELVDLLPNNAVLLNNIAFLYQAAGDPRALEFAERAHELRPADPAINDTLGWILVNRGDIQRGLPMLEMARQALPDRSEVRYRYAAALAKSGRRAEALQELAALLNEGQDFSQRDDAGELLQSLR